MDISNLTLSKQDVILNDSILFNFKKQEADLILKHKSEAVESSFFRYIVFTDQFYRTTKSGDLNTDIDCQHLHKVDNFLQSFFVTLMRYCDINQKALLSSVSNPFPYCYYTHCEKIN
jgi:hypothetical protein